jgi:hypothetical protein
MDMSKLEQDPPLCPNCGKTLSVYPLGLRRAADCEVDGLTFVEDRLGKWHPPEPSFLDDLPHIPPRI